MYEVGFWKLPEWSGDPLLFPPRYYERCRPEKAVFKLKKKNQFFDFDNLKMRRFDVLPYDEDQR